MLKLFSNLKVCVIGEWSISWLRAASSGFLDPVHTGPDPYGHHINLTSFKTSMTLKFVIILQDLIKTYHRKSGKSKCDRKVTELNVEITLALNWDNAHDMHDATWPATQNSFELLYYQLCFKIQRKNSVFSVREIKF